MEYYMDIIEATKIIEEGVLLIPQSYKIVEKDETKPLIKVLDECNQIWNAWNVMSFPTQADIIDKALMIKMLNAQIIKKLVKLYRYYSRHFNIYFDGAGINEENSECTLAKATEDNISLICETVRSWEE